MQGSNGMPRGKGPGSAWVGVILLLLVIGIVCFGFFVYPNFSKDLKQNNPSDNTPNNNENTDTDTETTDNQNNNNNNTNTDTSKPKDTYKTLECSKKFTIEQSYSVGGATKITFFLNYKNNVYNKNKTNFIKGEAQQIYPSDKQIEEEVLPMFSGSEIDTVEEAKTYLREHAAANQCEDPLNRGYYDCSISNATNSGYVINYSQKLNIVRVDGVDYLYVDDGKNGCTELSQTYSKMKDYFVSSGYTCK